MRRVGTKNKRAFRRDLAIVKKLWPGQVHGIQRESLKELCREHQFSVRVGDLQLLEGRWYVTHSGLVRLSRRNGCAGIRVHQSPDSATLKHTAGSSRQQFTNHRAHGAS